MHQPCAFVKYFTRRKTLECPACPYLTPEPHRGTRPNTPEMVVHVAAFLAKRRGLSLADFAKATDATAIRFYGLSIGEGLASQR